MAAISLTFTTAAAQPAQPSAATVLANVQQFYANATHMSAAFRQIVTNATFNTAKTSDGKLWLAKPAKFRFDYMTKQKNVPVVVKTFAFDGATLWMVDHENKEVLQSQVQTSLLPVAVSFLTGASNLATQFNVALTTSTSFGGRSSTVLELTPKQPSAQFMRLFFVVDPSDWHVSESIVIDANGDTNDFKFYMPDVQAAVSTSWFQVSPSALPGYKLVVQNTGAAPTTSPPPASSPGAAVAPKP